MGNDRKSVPNRVVRDLPSDRDSDGGGEPRRQPNGNGWLDFWDKAIKEIDQRHRKK